MTRVGVYARISLDRRHGEGIDRQVTDCRELIAKRWPDAEIAEYIDNDISAFRAKRRPSYEQLLTDLSTGRLSAVVAYHSDRFYRRLTDLETFVNTVQEVGAEVATVKSGDVDLATATGRMLAGILGAVAKGESERMSERVSRAKQQRTAKGRPGGGGRRAYGLTADRTALVPAEADVLRSAAAAILSGTSWSKVVNDLNASGTRNGSGGHWTTGNLRRTLVSPHVAGLAIYQGRIVSDAQWPPILDRYSWELLRAETASRRRGRPPSDRHLLTGLLACAKCGNPLWANSSRGRRTYQCRTIQATTGRGCGGISILAQPAEEHVVGEVGGWLRRPAFRAALSAYLAYGDASAAGARAELDDVARRRVALEGRWASGATSDDGYALASAILDRRAAEAEARMAGIARRPGRPVSVDDLAAAWAAFTVPERREAIRLVASCPIVVVPAMPGGRLVDRIGLRPIWETDT